MNILISNDDGYFAEGIQVLKTSLVDAGHTVFMVAPDRNNSGCGMSISLRKPVTVREISSNEYVVSGTPVDCVGLALRGLIKENIDIVVSGINDGANLADDIFYSGTVAAAMEARRLKYPSIAVSMAKNHAKYFLTAVHVVNQLLEKIDRLPNRDELAFLNVNVPDVSLEDLNGCKVAKLGSRHDPIPHKEEIIKERVRHCWIGPVGPYVEQKSNDLHLFDHELIEQGFASITPVKAEWLHTPFLDACNDWLGEG